MEATKERREQQERKATGAGEGADSVQLPTETSPYVQYNKDDGLEDYKMRAYGAQGHLPVSDVPHGSGTDTPTIPGTALPTQHLNLHGRQQPQRGAQGGGAGAGRADETATDTINRHGVP